MNFITYYICIVKICRFCWHRIRTDENELCPACRKEYPENPADFKPLTQEEVSKISNNGNDNFQVLQFYYGKSNLINEIMLLEHQ